MRSNDSQVVYVCTRRVNLFLGSLQVFFFFFRCSAYLQAARLLSCQRELKGGKKDFSPPTEKSTLLPQPHMLARVCRRGRPSARVLGRTGGGNIMITVPAREAPECARVLLHARRCHARTHPRARTDPGKQVGARPPKRARPLPPVPKAVKFCPEPFPKRWPVISTEAAAASAKEKRGFQGIRQLQRKNVSVCALTCTYHT